MRFDNCTSDELRELTLGYQEDVAYNATITNATRAKNKDGYEQFILDLKISLPSKQLEIKDFFTTFPKSHKSYGFLIHKTKEMLISTGVEFKEEDNTVEIVNLHLENISKLVDKKVMVTLKSSGSYTNIKNYIEIERTNEIDPNMNDDCPF